MNDNKQNDAYIAMTELLQQKKDNNELKNISEVDNVNKLVEEKIGWTEEEITEIERYEIGEVYDSMETIIDQPVAEDADLSKIHIVQKNAIERNSLLKNVLSISSSTFEVIAAQSGYSCKVAPLTNKDSFNILNSTSSEYENTRMTYKVIYSKIKEFSCGPMSFDEWLKNTSVGDLESFYYGLYCATFLDEGGFRFTCPDMNCQHVTDQVIRNKSLRQVADFEDMKKHANRISTESIDIASMKKLSILDSAAHVKLKNTGLIVELKIPSLWNFLELYRNIDEKVLRRHDDADVNALLCVSGMLIPDGKGGYVADNDKTDILDALDNLPFNDAAALKKAITNILEKKHVSYTIKSVKCAKCGKEIKNVPINLRSILFTKIYAMR